MEASMAAGSAGIVGVLFSVRRLLMKEVLRWIDRLDIFGIIRGAPAEPDCTADREDAMSSHQETKEGGPPSKTPLSEEHGRPSRAERRSESCVSMEREHSMDGLVQFEDGNDSIKRQKGSIRIQQDRDHPSDLKDGRSSREERKHPKKSNRFCGRTTPIKRAEEDAHAFLDKELKKLWSVLFLHYPQCSESQREEEEVVDGKKEEQRRRAIEGEGDIVQFCLVERNHGTGS
ncbi:hypothetical protein CRUP_033776 [Coryphaenoides rupestris]|nr:hypothetical protein CRUP_033776 [Coryphaenoides rupestris]